MSEVPTSSIPIPTADLTIPTMEPASGAPFDMGKYGFTEEEYPELAGKSEGEVLSFIVQALSQPAEVAEAPAPLPTPEPEKSSGFGAAWDYGSDNLQAMLGAGLKVLGQATDVETLEEYGQEIQDKNEKEAEESLKKYDRVELKDVSPGDNLTTFVIQILGETLPSLGLAIGAGITGATAATLTPVAALTGTIGAGIGAYLPSALTITGEAQITAEQLSKDEAFESPGTMLLAGAAGGVLDTIALAVPAVKLLPLNIPSSALTKFFVSKGVSPEVAEGAVKKARQALKDADNNPDVAVQKTVLEGRSALKKIAESKPIKGRNVLNRALRGGLFQAGLEGVTEAGQQAITTAAAEIATGEEVEDYGYNLLDAAVRGGIAGFGPGALAGGITGRSKAAAQVAQEKQEKLQEALVLDEANSSPDFDEETSGVVSMQERTVGEDTFVEIIEQDAEDRVRTQRIKLDDIISIEPTEDEIIASQQNNKEVTEEEEARGLPSEGTALNNVGVTNREGLAFNADEDVEANVLAQEVYDLKSEITILERIRKLRPRSTDPTQTLQEDELAQDINITELIEQRKAKLSQYRKFLNSNNNKLKYESAYNSLIRKNKKLQEALDQELALDFTYLSDVDSTIEGLESNLEAGLISGLEPAFVLPSELNIQESLDKIGEIVNLEKENGLSVLSKLKAGRDRLSSGLSFDESMTIDNLSSFQKASQEKFPKLMDPVDTTPPQNPRVNERASSDVQEGINNLASAASEAEGSRGRRIDIKNIINKPTTDPENLATKLSMWSRFMSSSYQQATKYPLLRPLVKVMEEYNIIWRSIMNNSFMGRTLVYALNAQNKAQYREITELKNIVNQDVEISGVDGNKKLVLNLTDPSNPVNRLTQLYGERDPNTGQRTGEYRIRNVNDPRPNAPEFITVPALFKYKDIYGYALTEEEYIAKYTNLEDDSYNHKLILENIEGDAAHNKRTQLLINAMEQEQNTIRTLYDQAITAVINRGLFILEPSIRSQVESTEATIIQERKSAGEFALTEGKLAVAAMERVAAAQRNKEAGQDATQNTRNIKQLEQQIEVITGLDDARRLGYFPRSRTGDIIVRIIRTTYDPDGNKKEEVIHREDHVSPLYRRKVAARKKAVKDRQGKDLERRIRTTEGFNPATDKVDITVKTKENENLIKNSEIDNFFILESVMLSELDHSKNLTDEEIKRSKKIFEQVAQRIRQQRETRGFRRHLQHRRNIPGAITPTNEKSYHNNAWAQYVSTLGRFVARQRTDEAANQIIKDLTTDDHLQVRGQTLWDNTKAPQSMVSAIKSMAFLGYLAGNISSSFLNLTQNFVTASILYGAYGKLLNLKTAKSAIAAGVLTTKYLMGKDIGFQAKDREAIANDLFRLRAASSLEIGRKQFDLLLELQEKGIVGKINTEAMSSNSDITSSQMIQKLFGTFPGAVEQKLTDKQYQAITKAAGVSKRIIDYVYAFSEVGNRINAALATYNTVEAFGLEGDVNPKTGKSSGGLIGFAKGTAFEGQILTMADAASFVINQSQFNLDAFNRPQIAFAGKGLGAITLQFLPFVTMLIEVYSNAIGKYGGSTFNPIKFAKSLGDEGSIDPRNMSPQGKRTLVFLLVPQLMVGGLFGLPFVDDLREVYKLVGNLLNIQDTDVELMFYEGITSVGGPEAYQTAQFFGRGAFKTYLGIDIAQRTSISPLRSGLLPFITDEKSVAELIGGPATSYLTQAIKASSQAFKRGDYGMAVLKLIPVAGLQNVLKAIDASEAGVQTGAGRVIGDGLTTQNLLMMSLGFAPRPVYEDRDRMYRERYHYYKNSGVRKAYIDRAVRVLSQIDRTESAEEKRELYDELQKLYMEVYEHDLKADLVNQIDPNHTIQLNVNERFMKDKLGRQSGIPQGTAKSVVIREEILGGNFKGR